MSDIIVPLTADEQSVLMLAAAGAAMIEIGRWEQPTLDLVKRGYLTGDKFNHYITDAGRAALKDFERAEDAELGRVIDGVKAEIAKLPVGPEIVGGRLFFNLPNGQTTPSNITEPWASQIIEMWKERP